MIRNLGDTLPTVAFFFRGVISQHRVGRSGLFGSKAYEHKPMPPYVNKQKQEMK